MNYKRLTNNTLEILAKKVKETASIDTNTIEYRVAVVELSDCTSLLASNFDPVAVERIKGSTTCGELYDLLISETTEPFWHGRWIGEVMEINGSMARECSKCHKIRVIDNYCSNCGAAMERD